MGSLDLLVLQVLEEYLPQAAAQKLKNILLLTVSISRFLRVYFWQNHIEFNKKNDAWNHQLKTQFEYNFKWDATDWL